MCYIDCSYVTTTKHSDMESINQFRNYETERVLKNQ